MTKIALVTGASTGFGHQIVADLLANNWTVIATMRNAPERLDLFQNEQKHHPEHLIIQPLDVTQANEMDQIVAYLHRQHRGHLDLLVNNAGFGVYGALEDLSEDLIRTQMETNFFGPIFLTRKLLPLLRHSKGRVITITSIMGRYSMPLVGMYSASKYALEGLHEALYYELQHMGVQVCTVQPGGFRTQFLRSVQWGENSKKTDSIYYQMGQNFQNFMNTLTSRNKAPGPENVSQAVLKLLQKKQMPRSITVGKDASALAALQKGPRTVYQQAIKTMSKKIFGI